MPDKRTVDDANLSPPSSSAAVKRITMSEESQQPRWASDLVAKIDKNEAVQATFRSDTANFQSEVRDRLDAIEYEQKELDARLTALEQSKVATPPPVTAAATLPPDGDYAIDRAVRSTMTTNDELDQRQKKQLNLVMVNMAEDNPPVIISVVNRSEPASNPLLVKLRDFVRDLGGEANELVQAFPLGGLTQGRPRLVKLIISSNVLRELLLSKQGAIKAHFTGATQKPAYVRPDMTQMQLRLQSQAYDIVSHLQRCNPGMQLIMKLTPNCEFQVTQKFTSPNSKPHYKFLCRIDDAKRYFNQQNNLGK